MREISRSALVPYSDAQMFALVADIEAYPQFLPWCSDAAIIERDAQSVTASLELVKAGVHERFTTRNLLSPPQRMHMQLVSGPFKTLDGIWVFTPIQDRGEDKGARIDLTMRFEFANPVLGLLLSRSFEASCNSLVDAFTQRARAVYGAK